MRKLSLMCAGLGAAAALVLALTAPADAKSWTEGGSPGCLAKCGEYRQACLASGCWESKYVSRECGFAKQ